MLVDEVPLEALDDGGVGMKEEREAREGAACCRKGENRQGGRGKERQMKLALLTISVSHSPRGCYGRHA